MKCPKIKKKINAFLVGEEGKISKSNIIKGGIFLANLVLSLSAAEGWKTYRDHMNNDVNTLTTVTPYEGKHTNHSVHNSHGSHGSHNSHSHHSSIL